MLVFVFHGNKDVGRDPKTPKRHGDAGGHGTRTPDINGGGINRHDPRFKDFIQGYIGEKPLRATAGRKMGIEPFLKMKNLNFKVIFNVNFIVKFKFYYLYISEISLNSN